MSRFSLLLTSNLNLLAAVHFVVLGNWLGAVTYSILSTGCLYLYHKDAR